MMGARSHHGQQDLNKQSVSGELRFPFPPDNASRGKTENTGDRERALWELMGGGVRFSESDQRGTTGGLMSYISISFFAVLSGI